MKKRYATSTTDRQTGIVEHIHYHLGQVVVIRKTGSQMNAFG